MSAAARLLLCLCALASCRRSQKPPEAGSADAAAPAAEAPAPPEAGREAKQPAEAAAAPFVELYVAGWTLKGRPASSISVEGVTDLVLFSVLPRPDGSIDAATNGLTEARIAALKGRAPRTLVAIGGEKSAAMFRAPNVAESLAAFALAHGLDGVVVDVEPLAGISREALTRLFRTLHERLAPRLVTAVVAPDPSEIDRLAPVLGALDRVTIMSYLGEPSPEQERLLVDRLVTLGLERARIGVAIGPRTSPDAKERRLASVRERLVGGIGLWAVAAGAGYDGGGGEGR